MQIWFRFNFDSRRLLAASIANFTSTEKRWRQRWRVGRLWPGEVSSPAAAWQASVGRLCGSTTVTWFTCDQLNTQAEPGPVSWLGIVRAWADTGRPAPPPYHHLTLVLVLGVTEHYFPASVCTSQYQSASVRQYLHTKSWWTVIMEVEWSDPATQTYLQHTWPQ